MPVPYSATLVEQALKARYTRLLHKEKIQVQQPLYG